MATPRAATSIFQGFFISYAAGPLHLCVAEISLTASKHFGVLGRSWARMIVVFALASACMPADARASAVTPGTIIQLYDSYGTTGGGEFDGQIVGTSAQIDFISFCLETNEYFTPGQNLLVQDVSTEARAGGSGGPHPDPISNETAYLFTQFALGTLSDYAFASSGSDRVADANSLQRALWYLEQELGTTDTLTELTALDYQAAVWVNEATNAGWTDTGNVHVLNLLRQDSTGNYTIKAQDQLYYQSVPEPASHGKATPPVLSSIVRPCRRVRIACRDIHSVHSIPHQLPHRSRPSSRLMNRFARTYPAPTTRLRLFTFKMRLSRTSVRGPTGWSVRCCRSARTAWGRFRCRPAGV